MHDCVGLIKGYLWKNEQGKIIYNASQDKNVTGMLQNCSENGYVNALPELPGLILFNKNYTHVGIYIGNGEVIEAKGHSYGVVKTKLKDRNWYKWGKLDWLEYEEEKKMFTEGQELEAIDYLVAQGRINNKEQALQKLELIKNEGWTYIKWANDVKKIVG